MNTAWDTSVKSPQLWRKKVFGEKYWSFVERQMFHMRLESRIWCRLTTYLLTIHFTMLSVIQAIQGDSGGKANILGGDNIDHCEKIYIYINIQFWTNNKIELVESLDVDSTFFSGFGWKAKFIKETWIGERIARLRFGCCYPHIETRRSIQTNRTRCSHTNCEVQ